MDFPLLPLDGIEHPAVRALATFALAALAGAAFELIGARILAFLARLTPGGLDDQVVHALRRPVAFTIALVGAWYAVAGVAPPERTRHVLQGALLTMLAITWTIAALRLGDVVLGRLERGTSNVVQPASRPLFEILSRIFFFGACVYLILLAWRVDVTAWLASAGILGIAVGFAAQDTLANLISGLAILIDQPYKIGDFLVIDDQVRGRVTDIGMRSTRLITRDDVEVIIPNSQMASARIVNESGGPQERERVSAVVRVPFDADLGQVRRVLLECATGCPNVVLDDPVVAPRVRFREFGEFALVVHLLVWIPKPELRGLVLDELNTAILGRFRTEGIRLAVPVTSVRMAQEAVGNREDPTR